MDSSPSKSEVLHMEEGKNTSQDDTEKTAEVEFQGAATANLKLDKHGFPLVPQPTDRKDDPLVRQPCTICSLLPD
jgi:hypothetical protein